MAWFLILPLVFFALFSPGTMIEAPAEGGVRIVLCTGKGMVEAIMTADGRVVPDDGSDPAGQAGGPACDWALHGQQSLAGAAILPAPLIIGAASALQVGDRPLHLRRAEVLTPAARGPPILI